MNHHRNQNRGGTRRMTKTNPRHYNRNLRQNRSVNRIRVNRPVNGIRGRIHVIHTRRLISLILCSIRTSGNRSTKSRPVLLRWVNSRTNNMGTRSRINRPNRVSRSNPRRRRPRLHTRFPVRRPPRLLPTIPIRHTRSFHVRRASTSRPYSTSSTRRTTTRRPSRTNSRLKRSRLNLNRKRNIRRMTFAPRRVFVGTLSHTSGARRHGNRSGKRVRSRRGSFRPPRVHVINPYVFLPRQGTRRCTRRHRHRVRPRMRAFNNLRLVFRRLLRRLGASQGCTSALLPSISQVSSATQ